jgi:hypothetical protein
MVLECDDGEHARRWGKEIESHYKSSLQKMRISYLTE